MRPGHQARLRQSLMLRCVWCKIPASPAVVHDTLTTTPKRRETSFSRETPLNVLGSPLNQGV